MENLISHISKFITLSKPEIDLLHEKTEVVALGKKDFLLQEGEFCQANYFISQGCLRMYFIKENGIEQITQFAIENWWISDYMSLLTQTTSSFYLQAIENSRVIRLSTTSSEELFEEIPQLERYFRLVTQRAYAAAQFRVKFLYGMSREELFHHFSSHFPDFVQRVPQYMLASYLGFTPEYLSEIRKKR